jgi:hypothetical protein
MPDRTVLLAHVERDVPENILRELGTIKLRRDFSKRITFIFGGTSCAVLLIIVILIVIDLILFWNYGLEYARQRMIDRGVVKTLIGASVVQLGALMIAIAHNLFPTERRGIFRRLFGR